jgi:hypothetical protein
MSLLATRLKRLTVDFIRNIDRCAESDSPWGFSMTDQQHQEPVTRLSLGDIEQVPGVTNAPRALCQQDSMDKQQETELSSLQQCICQLLIENQQLRELLQLAATQPLREAADALDSPQLIDYPADSTIY